MARSENRHPLDPSTRGRWRRLLPNGIRARILFVVLLALIPLLVLLIGNSLARLFMVDQTALDENQQAARAAAAAFAAYVQDIRHQEVAIGTAIGIRNAPNWGWTDRLLAIDARQNPSFYNISWVLPALHVQASSAHATVGTDESGIAPISRLRAGGTWTSSDLLPAVPIAKSIGLIMAYAVRGDGGQLLGILVAEINPDNLANVLSRTPRPAGSIAALFDHQGHLVVSNPPRQGAWEERAAWGQSDPLLHRALNSGSETSGVVTPATFDTAMYAAYTPVAKTGYVLGVLRPRTYARAPVGRSVLGNLLLWLLISGLVVLIAYRISGTIVGPLGALREDVARLGRQQTVSPPAEEAPAELRALQTALVTVTASLFQRIDGSETQRDRLQTIIDQLPVGVRFVNAAGELLLVNPVARDMLGEDALGMASTPRGRYSLHCPDGSPLPLAEIPLVAALHEGKVSHNSEIVIRYEDGTGLLALDSATPVRDAQGTVSGVVEAVVAVVSDVKALQEISANTDLEQQLATVRIQLDTLLEILPVGVLLLNAQGQILHANAAGARLWGGIIPEVHALNDFRFFHGWWTRTGEPLRPDDWPPVRALSKNETVLNEAITLNRFDGLRGNVLTSAAPLHNTQGAICGAVWVIQDPITPK